MQIEVVDYRSNRLNVDGPIIFDDDDASALSRIEAMIRPLVAEKVLKVPARDRYSQNVYYTILVKIC